MVIRSHTADEFSEMFRALLPPGRAWPRGEESNLGLLLAGLAEELARLDSRKMDLLDEIDPRSASELLDEWESMLGLPDDCSDDLANETERRNYVIAKLRYNPGAGSIKFFKDLAAALGYSGITITETNTHEWTVDGTQYNEQWAKCGIAKCGDKIVERGDDFLYCLFLMRRPAHTHLVFTSHP